MAKREERVIIPERESTQNTDIDPTIVPGVLNERFAGKTWCIFPTHAHEIDQLGAPVDADLVARWLLQPDSPEQHGVTQPFAKLDIRRDLDTQPSALPDEHGKFKYLFRLVTMQGSLGNLNSAGDVLSEVECLAAGEFSDTRGDMLWKTRTAALRFSSGAMALRDERAWMWHFHSDGEP